MSGINRDVTIRKATVNDRQTLLQFEQGVIEAERPFDETLKQEATRYYDLDTLLTAANVYLAVAEIAGELVGCGYARMEAAKPFLQHSQYAYFGFMYVVPQHRGKGINQRIIDGLKEWAREKGVTELRLEVYAGNAGAIKAYEKAGFRTLMVEMRASV